MASDPSRPLTPLPFLTSASEGMTLPRGLISSLRFTTALYGQRDSSNRPIVQMRKLRPKGRAMFLGWALKSLQKEPVQLVISVTVPFSFITLWASLGRSQGIADGPRGVFLLSTQALPL